MRRRDMDNFMTSFGIVCDEALQGGLDGGVGFGHGYELIIELVRFFPLKWLLPDLHTSKIRNDRVLVQVPILMSVSTVFCKVCILVSHPSHCPIPNAQSQSNNNGANIT